MASSPEQMRHLVDRAVRIARDQRTVTCLIIPNDVAELSKRLPDNAILNLARGVRASHDDLRRRVLRHQPARCPVAPGHPAVRPRHTSTRVGTKARDVEVGCASVPE